MVTKWLLEGDNATVNRRDQSRWSRCRVIQLRVQHGGMDRKQEDHDMLLVEGK